MVSYLKTVTELVMYDSPLMVMTIKKAQNVNETNKNRKNLWFKE